MPGSARLRADSEAALLPPLVLDHLTPSLRPDHEIALIEIGKRLSAERRAASVRAKENSPSRMVTEKGSSDRALETKWSSSRSYEEA